MRLWHSNNNLGSTNPRRNWPCCTAAPHRPRPWLVLEQQRQPERATANPRTIPPAYRAPIPTLRPCTPVGRRRGSSSHLLHPRQSSATNAKSIRSRTAPCSLSPPFARPMRRILILALIVVGSRSRRRSHEQTSWEGASWDALLAEEEKKESSDVAVPRARSAIHYTSSTTTGRRSPFLPQRGGSKDASSSSSHNKQQPSSPGNRMARIKSIFHHRASHSRAASEAGAATHNNSFAMETPSSSHAHPRVRPIPAAAAAPTWAGPGRRTRPAR